MDEEIKIPKTWKELENENAQLRIDYQRACDENVRLVLQRIELREEFEIMKKAYEKVLAVWLRG